jgi:hydrogenase expression/formation protein HypD
MNFEYRSKEIILGIARHIAEEARPDKDYHFMEFCGGHTHAFFKFGLIDLLPKNIKMLHGPGCPVCVLAMERIDLALALAAMPDTILISYGDLLRVPGSSGKSLLHLRAEGSEIRMLYSLLDSIEIAESNPSKNIIIFAIGFETTTPATALLLKAAKEKNIKNLTIVCNHVLTPPAILALLNSDHEKKSPLDGVVGPGHVASMTGWAAFEEFAHHHKKPVVISGFEPGDLMNSVLMLVRQVNEGRSNVENELTRLVSKEGNKKAQDAVNETMELRSEFPWRGLGIMHNAALKIRKEYSDYDAELRFKVNLPEPKENKACLCGSILQGIHRPVDCPLFGKSCTPEHPVGSCMVSSEGACAAYYLYKNI